MILNNLIYLIVLFVLLVVGVILYFTIKRNYFNKYKYMRIVKYNDNMTESISYIKKSNFNLNNTILINPKHIYNYKGYTTIVITSNANESINPIDFESKFLKKDFETAMHSKVVAEALSTLKVDKFDKLMFLLILNVIQLVAIVYLLYTFMGSTK